MISVVDLEVEYQLTRAALLNAGVDLTGSIDALYRDWRRWREKPTFQPMNRVRVASVDQWWARHLEQFRSLIDPSHVAARTERIRKDHSLVHPRPDTEESNISL